MVNKKEGGSRPTIIRHLRNINATEFDYVRFDCFLIGEPQPEVTWYHNEQIISNNDRKMLLNKEDQYSLVINECEPEDFGDYKLTAVNSYGDAQSSCRLNVQVVQRKQSITQLQSVKPSIDAVFDAPKFEEELSDINIIEGYVACFQCKVSSKAPYELKWYKDGQELFETNRIKVSISFC